MQIVLETHAVSEDNEHGLASGWLPGRLSERGRELARELGERRLAEGLAAVFTSDLRRALETVELAFPDCGLPVLVDWRLRECDYGSLNGGPAAQVLRECRQHLTMPYPDGESWEQAIRRVGRFLSDLPVRWSGQCVSVIGHIATRWALDHLVHGIRPDRRGLRVAGRVDIRTRRAAYERDSYVLTQACYALAACRTTGRRSETTTSRNQEGPFRSSCCRQTGRATRAHRKV